MHWKHGQIDRALWLPHEVYPADPLPVGLVRRAFSSAPGFFFQTLRRRHTASRRASLRRSIVSFRTLAHIDMMDLFAPRIVVLAGPTIRHVDESENARRGQTQRANAANAAKVRAEKMKLAESLRAVA